jgi:hypothetical protein
VQRSSSVHADRKTKESSWPPARKFPSSSGEHSAPLSESIPICRRHVYVGGEHGNRVRIVSLYT